MKKTVLRRYMIVLTVVLLLACGGFAAWQSSLVPDTIYTAPGEAVELKALPGVNIKELPPSGKVGNTAKDKSRNAQVQLWGKIPAGSVRVVERERQTVKVCGELFGIKMFADGALVVGFSDLYTVSGPQNPAKEAGLQMGDWVVSLDGKPVLCNEDISAILKAPAADTLSLVYRRNGQTHHTRITPQKDQNGTFRAGIWVRDSSAGIGTMTFILGDSFAGLGHAISDSDTGQSIELRSGEIVPVELKGVEKGTAGTTGELQGSFLSTDPLGEILQNLPVGVYGRIFSDTLKTDVMQTAWMQEIETGPAEILCNVDGLGPRYYTVEIEKISYTAKEVNKNMLLRVTDPSLLEKTGGIVQGMSGSPIIQDGKLIGAVTHVLVNDPTMGYGIFIENMLDAAG